MRPLVDSTFALTDARDAAAAAGGRRPVRQDRARGLDGRRVGATDVLGPDYQVRTLELRPDDEGDVVASLVRYAPPTHRAAAPVARDPLRARLVRLLLPDGPRRVLARPRRRVLRPRPAQVRPQPAPGPDARATSTTSTTYDEELEASLDVITRGPRRARPRHGHGPLDGRARRGPVGATGTPGELSGLVLNSPWLELQGSSVLRHRQRPGRRAARPVPAEGAAAQHRPRLLRAHARAAPAAASGPTTPPGGRPRRSPSGPAGCGRS